MLFSIFQIILINTLAIRQKRISIKKLFRTPKLNRLWINISRYFIVKLTHILRANRYPPEDIVKKVYCKFFFFTINEHTSDDYKKCGTVKTAVDKCQEGVSENDKSNLQIFALKKIVSTLKWKANNFSDHRFGQRTGWYQ